ncbi:MAG: hypothetical protein J6Y82_01790 [Bacteroidales bacterium]|nr:hypothetical protein [Bacteroidales bacterium]
MWRISRDFDIPVVALSALSRAPEHRGMDCKPLLTDLRESSMIEVCADTVLLLYRPAYYNINEDPRGNSLTNYAEINVAKNNNGRCTNVALRYEEPCVFADGGDLRVVV